MTERNIEAWKESLIGLFWPGWPRPDIQLTSFSKCFCFLSGPSEKWHFLFPWCSCCITLHFGWITDGCLSFSSLTFCCGVLWYVVFFSKHNSMHFSPESSTFALRSHNILNILVVFCKLWDGQQYVVFVFCNLLWVTSLAVLFLDLGGSVNYQDTGSCRSFEGLSLILKQLCKWRVWLEDPMWDTSLSCHLLWRLHDMPLHWSL